MTQEEFLISFDSKARGFQMFTKAGNKKCQSITRKLIKKVFGSKRITHDELQDLAGELIAKAYMNKSTSEILDSEPPYHINFYVKKALVIAGYSFGSDSDITEKVWEHIKRLKSGGEK